MSLNFVTGKRGGAHISSADWRSLNRGIVGEGKFYLEDTTSNNNGEFLVNPSSGEITIPPRSFLWSGAHIRNDSLYIVKYVPPTSTSTINLWLHYVKDINSGIESLEFVTTIDSQPSPIADVIEDTTLEAYTAVYSFVHDAENLAAKNTTEYFGSVNSIKMLSQASNLMVEALVSEKNERIKADADEKTARESANASFETRISNNESAIKFMRGSVILKSYGNIAPTSSGVSLNIGNHDFNAFSFLVVKFGNAGSSSMNNHYAVIPVHESTYYHTQLVIEDVSLSSANKLTQLFHKFTVGKNSSGKLTLTHAAGNHSSDDYASQFWGVIAVYGIY